MNKFLLPIYMLWSRELVRFFRQRSRVIGALGTPLLFWFLIGSGFGQSFQTEGMHGREGYLLYFYPGSLLLILLFTAIFATFSLIQDRQEGFMQSVLVAPVPRVSIVLGKIVGGATIASLQGILFLLLAPVAGLSWSTMSFLLLVALIFILSLCITAFGFALAWKINSIQGFHIIMNLILMPAWFLSGALFPLEETTNWMRFIMKLNPLTYGLQEIRALLYGGSYDVFAMAVILIFGILSVLLSCYWINQRNAESLK